MSRNNGRPRIALGATLSTKYAESLELDWREAYTAILDDLGVRLLRIPAYRDRLEAAPGNYDFRKIEELVDKAERRDAKVILAVG